MGELAKWAVVEQISHWDYWHRHGAYDQLVARLYRQVDVKILEFLHTGKPYRVQYEPVEQIGISSLMPKDTYFTGVADVVYEFQLLVSIQEIEEDWQYKPEYLRG